jgi:hypothetical protein
MELVWSQTGYGDARLIAVELLEAELLAVELLAVFLVP